MSETIKKKTKYDTLLDAIISGDDAESDTSKTIKMLLDASTDLDLKTDIKSPQKFAAALTFADYLDKLGLVESAKLIKNYVDKIERLSISKDRKSRKEIVEMLKASSNDVYNQEITSKGRFGGRFSRK